MSKIWSSERWLIFSFLRIVLRTFNTSFSAGGFKSNLLYYCELVTSSENILWINAFERSYASPKTKTSVSGPFLSIYFISSTLNSLRNYFWCTLDNFRHSGSPLTTKILPLLLTSSEAITFFGI